jgi:hypothetical protein
MFTNFTIEIPYTSESYMTTLRFSELCYYLGDIFWGYWGIWQRLLVVIICTQGSTAFCKHAY